MIKIFDSKDLNINIFIILHLYVRVCFEITAIYGV